MLHQPTLEKLEAMRLHGMAQAWRELAKSEQAGDLSFEERMALLVDRSEYKRKQAAPGLKITSRAFGFGRPFPIAQRFIP